MEITTSYTQGISIAEIARHHKLSERTIQRRLIKANVWQKNKLPTTRRKSKYSYDEEFFNDINTEEKAYWLGFIAADGNISIDSRNRHYLRIKLAIKDLEHLKKLPKSMNATYPIITTEKTCTYTVCGKKIVESLIKKGITPRKTHTITWLKCIPKKLVNHFCRGYFDGDGCWHINKKNSPVFLITGNYKFIKIMQIKLIKNCNLNKTKIYRVKNTSTSTNLVYGGKYQCKKIYDFIYNNSKTFMERKKSIIENFFKSLSPELSE